jgi:hypothetical protein
MPDDKDDLFGEDGDEAVDDFNRLTDILFQRIIEFAEEEDVADELLAPLLLRLALTSRMVAYGDGRQTLRRRTQTRSRPVSPRHRGPHARDEGGRRSVHRTGQGVDGGG